MEEATMTTRRHRNGPIGPLLLLLGIAMLLTGSTPALARQTGSHGATTDANGWHVAHERVLDVDGEPLSLSPDGQWIAGLGPDRAFCVWDVDDLAPVCANDRYPIDTRSMAWAPDSTAVAFSLDFARLFTESDIFVFDIDRESLANLTDDGIDDDIPITELSDATEPVPVDVYPAWSLDGNELTFARTAWAAETRTTTLMTVSVTGGEPTELIELETDVPLPINSPMRWLDDGSLLYTIWTSVPDEADDGLWNYNPGDEPVQLLEGTKANDYPVPIVTDVIERNGATIALGFSPLLVSQYTQDPERSVGFTLDLETGDIGSLEAFAGIDNSGLGIGEQTQIIAPARIAPDGLTLILGIGQLGTGTLAIAEAGTGESPLSIGLEPRSLPLAAFHGYAWASNDTILVPLTEGQVVLLTLERPTQAPA